MIFGAKWSWESACFVSVVSGQLRWVESSENFQSSKNSWFFFVQTPKMEANVLVDPWWIYLKTRLECIEIMHICQSDSLLLFCILLKLYTTKFQSKRSSLRCDPLEQENLPGMKMLTRVGYARFLSLTHRLRKSVPKLTLFKFYLAISHICGPRPSGPSWKMWPFRYLPRMVNYRVHVAHTGIRSFWLSHTFWDAAFNTWEQAIWSKIDMQTYSII